MRLLSVKYCFIIFALLLSAPLQAAWYQVEVIVFEHLEPDADGEIWYGNPGLPSPEDSIELTRKPSTRYRSGGKAGGSAGGNGLPENGAELTPYQILSADKYRLKKDYASLKRSKNYRPLLHIAWQQPGSDGSEARPVHIEKKRVIGLEKETSEDEFLPEFPGPETEKRSYPFSLALLDGTVRLRSARYLHVDVDFAFFPESFPPSPDLREGETESRQHQPGGGLPQDAGVQDDDEENAIFVEQEADYVRLTETRKIKLNELHYFDHPLFGVLLQVSRMEAEW